MSESHTMSPAPAVRCTDCQYHWNSPAMAEGLRLLGSCPKCGGALSFEADAPTAPTVVDDRDRFANARTAPHLVLGIPRR
jgi:hypothetical protein